jgi:hypothetical protein
MTLNKGERMLAIAIVGVLVLIVGWGVWSAVGDPFSGLGEERDRLQAEVDERESERTRLLQAKQQLESWKKRSLPTDTSAARNEYREWLAALAEKEGRFGRPPLGPPEMAGSKGNVYTAYKAQLKVKGTLAQLRDFLKKFYTSGNLQVIRRLSIKTTEGSKELDITMDVEALALSGANRPKGLTTEQVNLLAATDASLYDTLVIRDPFAPPKPPPIVTPPLVVDDRPKPLPFDRAKYAVVTGIVEIDGQRAARVWSRTTEEFFTLHEGEAFAIGNFKGQVVRINPKEVILLADGKQTTVPLGESLRGESKLAGSSETKPSTTEVKTTSLDTKLPSPDAKVETKSDSKAEAPSEGKSDDRRKAGPGRGEDRRPEDASNGNGKYGKKRSRRGD